MTALDMIKGAMRLIGVIDPSETPQASEAQDGLSALNAMIDSWSLERLLIYNVATTTQNITAGKQEYTVGPGGDWDMVRPVKVDLIDSSSSTVDPLPIRLPFSQNLTAPLISVRLDSVPYVDATVNVSVLTQLTRFPDLSTEAVLPPGYERALRYNLAVEISPEYGNAKLSNAVISIATQSKSNLKSVNGNDGTLRCDEAMLHRRSFDIRTGGF